MTNASLQASIFGRYKRLEGSLQGCEKHEMETQHEEQVNSYATSTGMSSRYLVNGF